MKFVFIGAPNGTAMEMIMCIVMRRGQEEWAVEWGRFYQRQRVSLLSTETHTVPAKHAWGGHMVVLSFDKALGVRPV